MLVADITDSYNWEWRASRGHAQSVTTGTLSHVRCSMLWLLVRIKHIVAYFISAVLQQVT
jgi:hypothetical protein